MPATDSSDNYDLPLSRRPFPTALQYVHDSGGGRFRICEEVPAFWEPSQLAKEELILEHNKTMKRIEAIFSSGIAKNEDNPAWEALGRFGTLSGFADIASALAQLLKSNDPKRIQCNTVPASPTISVPPRRSERVVKNSHIVASKIGKTRQAFIQQIQKQPIRIADQGEKVTKKTDPRAFASMIVPCFGKTNVFTTSK